jgi:hypothetical protein
MTAGLYKDLESLYEFSEKLNRDLLFHVSFVSLLLKIGNPNYTEEFFNLDLSGLKDDAAQVALVSRIGAFLNHGSNFSLAAKLITISGNKITILEGLHVNCSVNQLNLKQSAFKVLKDSFDKISRSAELSAEYHADPSTASQMFELVMQNWEFPIRGFGNAMEDVFEKYLLLFPTQETKVKLLQEILLKYPGATRRKYASLRLILKGVDVDEYLKVAPGILREILLFEGIGQVPFMVQLLKELLTQAYLKYSKSHSDPKLVELIPQVWTEFWIKDYIDAVLTGSYKAVEELNEYVNPHIFTICEKSLPIVIAKLFNIKTTNKRSIQSVQASLLRYARSKDIFVCEDNQFKLLGVNESELNLTTAQWREFVEEIATHNNRHIALDAIKLILEPKKDSLAPQQVEYELLEKLIIFNTKNSYPDFRNDFSMALKRFLHRLRNNFNPSFKKITSFGSFRQVEDSDAHFARFVNFLRRLRQFVEQENYPDAPYESVYPLLESIKVVYESFNDQPFYFRKKTRFEG